MNLFEYMVWRAENKANREYLAKEEKLAEQEEKEREELSVLRGEVNGLRAKIRTYHHANNTLVFSNHPTTAEFEEELAKKEARIEYLREKWAIDNKIGICDGY